jgi:hypothetical protein
MKRKFASMLIIILLSFELFCHKIINNSGKPSKQDSGRQVPLKIDKIIVDDGEHFYFKLPYNIKEAADGCFYVQDQDQFLKFSPDGKFVKNLMKKGQGAGELVNISNYLLLTENEIVIHNNYPNKIIKIDANGKLLFEKRIYENKYMTVFHQDRDRYFFLNREVENTKGKAKMVEVDLQILSVLKSDFTIEKKFSFTMINFAFRAEGVFAIIRTTPFLICPFRENLLFISHTHEYGIKLIDLDSSKIVFEFKRDYERVRVTEENKKYLPPGHFTIAGKLQKPPTPKYLNDIQSIHFINNKLWVFTSTVDKEKGVLVDVFDENGKYVDCFYLKFQYNESNYKLEQNKLAVGNNVLYLVEQNKEGNWMITKYLIPPGK